MGFDQVFKLRPIAIQIIDQYQNVFYKIPLVEEHVPAWVAVIPGIVQFDRCHERLNSPQQPLDVLKRRFLV